MTQTATAKTQKHNPLAGHDVCLQVTQPVFGMNPHQQAQQKDFEQAQKQLEQTILDAVKKGTCKSRYRLGNTTANVSYTTGEENVRQLTNGGTGNFALFISYGYKTA